MDKSDHPILEVLSAIQLIQLPVLDVLKIKDASVVVILTRKDNVIQVAWMSITILTVRERHQILEFTYAIEC